MTLAPVWRTRLFATAAAILAVWMGSAVANEDLALPAMLVAALACVTVVWIQPLPLTTVLLGVAVIGYVVGNRGFAQVSPTDRLPLLPAELVLLIGCSVLAVQSAFRREVPWRRDLLNFAVLAWIVVGLGRLGFDLRTHGVAALRDFAMVYYAMFFLLAQQAGGAVEPRRFLHGCLAVSCGVLLVTQALYEQFPDFFLGTLTLRGVPLIFYKGDLAGSFMAVGALIFFVSFERDRRWWQLVLSLALTAGTLSANNRASMLGLGFAGVLLALAGRWRFIAVQAIGGVVAAVALLLAAYVSNKPWEQTAVHDMYERAISLADPFGQRTYSGEITSNKGDNNRFRTVWWQAVLDETIENDPWLGLGFGYDLSARFVREYYPDAGDEFSTRSPHNVVITIFGRMGLLGLVPFLVVAGVMIQRTIRAARRGPTPETALWCAAWAILTSACFGVVLEGPMGAVVFWITLGIANAAAHESTAPKPVETPAAGAAEIEAATSP